MNGRHNDESNSSHFSTDFLQQSNEEEGNRELLPFTQHFSLCQEFLKCHKNNSHASWIVNNFLWTFHYVSSSTQTPCNPSKTANSQRTLCPATQMPRGMEERTPCSTRPQRREKQMLLGGGCTVNTLQLCQNLGKPEAITQSERNEKLPPMVISPAWLVAKRKRYSQALQCQSLASHEKDYLFGWPEFNALPEAWKQ